jgi:hypothetical protein
VRRLPRILLNALRALSMILFAATVTLWVRSHLVRDYSFAWLPWPADTRGRRYLKVDADSGGG